MAYIVPLDLSFSVWFFGGIVAYAGRLLQHSAGKYIHPYTLMAPRTLNLGGLVMFFVYSLYLARSDLKEIVLTALDKTKNEQIDANEPLSYRMTVVGLILGVAFLLVFMRIFLKVPMWGALLYFLLSFAAVLGFARVRASGPTHSWVAGGWAIETLSMIVGKGYSRDKFLGLSLYSIHLDLLPFGTYPSLILESYHLGDSLNIKRRSISRLIVFTFVISFVSGIVFYLPTIYEYGQNNLDRWLSYYPMAEGLRNIGIWNWSSGGQPERNLYLTVLMGGSMIVTALLFFLYTRFVWWPFHPLGWVMAGNEAMHWVWGSFLVGWGIKWLMYRYAGPAAARRLIPFFVGAMLGQSLAALLTMIVGNILIFI